MHAGDAAWLHMDRPFNRMIVNTVMWFDEPQDWDAVRQVVQQRLIDRYPRFSQRVVEMPAFAWWKDSASFNLDAHLHHDTLPAPGGRNELEKFVSNLLHQHLPLRQPLWEMHLVDGFNGRGSAIVARIHHCIADGIALSRVMMSLTDDPSDEVPAQHRDVKLHRSRVMSTLAGIGGNLVGDVLHPGRIARQLADGAAFARALAVLVTLPPDKHTSLGGSADLYKRVVWSDPFPLAQVRDLAHAADVTVNDVAVSAVSGAVRDHLLRADGSAPDVRAVLPVNLRRLDEPLPTELGNRFGLAYISLPVSISDRYERLAETGRRTTAMKHSAEGSASFAILDLVGRTPYGIEQSFVDLFASKATAVITNVPGPRRPVYLAGRRVRGTIGWPPESGNLGLGVSVISYDGQLIIGLLADEHLIPDPGALLAGISAELRTLLDAHGPEVPNPHGRRPLTQVPG
jgi:diacylglycerol O-acyltransferase